MLTFKLNNKSIRLTIKNSKSKMNSFERQICHIIIIVSDGLNTPVAASMTSSPTLT